MPTTKTVIGWDIGGAHVKAAMLRESRLDAVRQWPCALWQGLHLLDAVIDDALAGWPDASLHAVTMTGELVDLFDSRKDGVIRIVRHLQQRLGPDLHLFCRDGTWMGCAAAAERWREVASANWAATASLVAARLETSPFASQAPGAAAMLVPSAMLVDVGSTTTDFIPLSSGRVLAVGHSDPERLRSGELLYQGVVRTPLCALAERIEFGGRHYNLMNEWFATTADVYRLTGELDPDHDQHPAADNGPKDADASIRRIARMIGHEAHDAPRGDWLRFAGEWRRRQLARLRTELARVERQATGGAARQPLALVGAGCGSFLVAALARDTGRAYVGFADLVDAPAGLRAWADVCAPAVAVALLSARAGAPAA